MTKYYLINIIKIIVLLILFLVIYYLQLNGNLTKYVKKNWSYYKCQPYILPIAGLFRPNDKISFLDFTLENFQKCKWIKIKGFFSFFMKPLQYIVDIIIKIINNFKNTLNIFRIEAKKIRGMFKDIVENQNLYCKKLK